MVLSRRRRSLLAASVVLIAGVVGFAEIPIGNGAAVPIVAATAPSATPSFEIPSAPAASIGHPFGSATPTPVRPSTAPTTAPAAVLVGTTDLTRAGYAAAGAAYTEVAAQWTQPGPACGQVQQRSVAMWVGMSSRASGNLEEVGTQVDCVGNSTSAHYAWFQAYPSPAVRLAVAIRAGDRIAARVTRTASTFTFSLTNITLSAAVSATRTVSGAIVDTVGWMVEARRFTCTTGCAAPPLAPFGTVTFTALAATGSGRTGGLAVPGWTTERLTMVGGDGTTKAAPSGIVSGGRSFEVVWRST